MNKELSDIFGKPRCEKNKAWDTGFTIGGEKDSRKIIDRNGKETGYLIIGEANPKIINPQGKTIAYIDGHIHKKICNIFYDDTGYFISGKDSQKIYYSSNKN
jgi:hypothetical protein